MTEESNIREFLRALNPVDEKDLLLAICYYVELVEGITPFRVNHVENAFRNAKQRAPSNVSRALTRLAHERTLLQRPRGSAKDYELALATIDRFAERLTRAGWLASAPPERIHIVREVSQSLEAALHQISDERERDYVEEALSCLNPQVSAYRAAIVMGWSAAMWNIRRKLERRGLGAFNMEFVKRFPKAKRAQATVLDDFEEYRDHEILGVAEALNVISKATYKVLTHHLDIRNNCGHPTDYKPEIHRVKTFFEEIISHVLARP